MKINWNNKYATIAIYAFLVICGSILLYLGIARFTEIKSGINDFIGTLQPFIIGTALAYLLNFIFIDHSPIELNLHTFLFELHIDFFHPYKR